MCGIAGYFGQGDRGILERMTNTLTHRGPDDVGFYINGQLGFGFRRLSIIDLSPLGHQPMENSDGNIVVIFNGEIYNFVELRQELEKKGYRFKSKSDTEVIIYAYAEYGTECFSKMNGMFAIALYDKKNQRVILARDRLGKKPLYWSKRGDTLMFGSELKALMAHPLFEKDIDRASLNKYFAFDYIPTPHTIFKEVYKLEPGHYLTYEKGNVMKTCFWDMKFTAGNFFTDTTDILKELDKRLEKAVTSRLVSDVPLGIFLSGGLDSSTIAYYAQKGSKEKIKTFSIGFQEKSFDESNYARAVAQLLGTDHHEHILTPQDALDVIPKIASVIDEPLADYSIIPTYLLSKFTRRHVTVALGGDGGDELFFGYPTFQAERLFPLIKAGAPLIRLLEKMLPVSHEHFNMKFKLHQLLQGINVEAKYRHHAWMGTFLNDELGIMNYELNRYKDIDIYYEKVKNEPRWNQLVYLYLKTYLMDQVLVKVDRASMANSLEVRAPFLDYEFVDFVNSIDYRYKVHGLTAKYLLKRLMESKLPSGIVHRPKQGFGVPISAWLTGELKPLLLDMLSEERIRREGIFKPEIVTRLVTEHLGTKRDHRKALWSLLVWQLWQDAVMR